MHIMLMAQCYAPEEVSAAVLITELATDLAKRGHRVTVITGAPSYPYGRVFRGYRNRLYASESSEGVRVIRTWSTISPSKASLARILHYGTYSATAFYGALLAGKPDVLLSFSPPLTLGVTAWLLSRIWKIPWVLQLEDLHPDAAVAAGMLRSPRIIRIFSALERFQYRKATHISLIAECFRKNLLGKGIPPEKITLIPVWGDPDFVCPMPKENAFREELGLAGKFVVMYAGNLGITSSLEDVPEAARLLKPEPDVRFVFVGEGVKKPRLEEIAKSHGLDNVIFLPYQPRQAYPQMMAAADLSLVTLNTQSSLSSLPSKTFNIMASARPILAVTPPESDLSLLIEEGGCGVTVPPGQPEQLAGAILQLKRQNHHLLEMGQKGRSLLETRFSRKYCVDQYEIMLQKLFS